MHATASFGNDVAQLALHGALDENTASVLSDALRKVCERLDHIALLSIDCAGITSINSIGVQGWIRAFGGLPQDLPRAFRNCRVGFVDYVNLIPSFAEPHQIESFEVPLICTSCGHRDVQIAAASVFAHGLAGAHFDCRRCGSGCEGQIPLEDYVGFLYRDP